MTAFRVCCSIVLVALVALLASPIEGLAQGDGAFTETSVIRQERTGDVSVPCLDETLRVTRVDHLITHTTVDATGGYHFTFEWNYQQGRAVGLESGRTFVAPGQPFHETDYIAPGEAPVTITIVNHIIFIGQGGAPDVVAKELFHVTVDANGNLSVLFDTPSVDCRP
jgi:hypothetical protein